MYLIYNLRVFFYNFLQDIYTYMDTWIIHNNQSLATYALYCTYLLYRKHHAKFDISRSILTILNIRFCFKKWISSVGSSNNHSSFVQVGLNEVKVNDCPAWLDNWYRRVRAPPPPRGQKQEKSYCDYLKNTKK